MDFDEWSQCVLTNCGHYYSTPTSSARAGIGDFRLRRVQGIEVAEMSCRIDRIERQRAGIRRDDNEFLFLLLQKTGEMGIRHNGHDTLLRPGDGLLMDSTRTAELLFEGRDASFASVHLPRAICLEGRAESLIVGRRVERSHPLHASLMNLLAEDSAPDGSSDYLFDFIALMFRDGRGSAGAAGFRDRRGRYRFVRETVERNLSDPEFSIEALAALVHMSRRQLQREFRDNGTTFTRFLLERRLTLVASHLRRMARMGARPSISGLAYRAGFSDLSHFNRGFRQLFEMPPGDFYARSAQYRLPH
ncbi:helix-turn-helix domain-containing protein [Paracoccus sediminicola]|uniref:helix-turn-helix domain-containing protein n=1 Tax=Paracoccus sediminicola TaxID=3017783 RepID=UPI0022F0F3FF|nr:helix-turn-helix domain-containing protein [Paracoccus sediminicola]WBU58319.1 helix-turn-helix domain-containing protein [Paracoccus sediminicola]